MDDIFSVKVDFCQYDFRPERLPIAAGVDPFETIVPLLQGNLHHLFRLFERESTVRLILGTELGRVQVEHLLFGAIAQHFDDRFVAIDKFTLFEQ
ncbi:hypothetical protein D3C81_1799220 [compost metagenome]